MENSNQSVDSANVPRLKRLADFKAALSNYHVSASAQRILDETRFAILIGPTSSGRDTIMGKLVENGGYNAIVSDTTRPQRVNNGKLEQDGVEYWFKTEDEFLKDLKNGDYLEAEIIHGQQVSGTSVRELEKAHDDHKIAITDVDIGGTYNIVKAKPDTAVILILPPSFEEWQRRFKNRGNMSAEEYNRRMQTALNIFSAPFEHDFFKIVINDDLAEAVRQTDIIARAGQVDPEAQQNGLHIAGQLLDRLREELARTKN